MNRIITFLFASFILIVLLNSCDSNCKDILIEKKEWVISSKEVFKDTLVSYSITENKREYLESYKEIKHTVTIRNENNLYTNQFSLKINYGYFNTYDESREIKTDTLDFVEIKPNSSYTFTYYSQGGYYPNFDNYYSILQHDTSISFQERQDELITTSENVNTCAVNVEALKERYKTVEELYNQYKKSN